MDGAAWKGALTGPGDTRRSWRHRGTLPAAELLHPSVLLALVLLGLNDHVLKTRFGGGWTGKLSDFAGLYAFPFVLTSCWNTLRYAAERARGRTGPPPRLGWPVALGATALATGGFSAVQLWRPAAAAYVDLLAVLGRHAAVVMDPWDLTALAVLPLVLLRFRSEIGPAPPTGPEDS